MIVTRLDVCPECGSVLELGYWPGHDGDVEPGADCTSPSCPYGY